MLEITKGYCQLKTAGKILLLITLLLRSVTSAAQDYALYHKSVNNAEITFFLEQDTISAIKAYDSVLNAFDFVFLRDVLNAAQIAALKDDSVHALNFIYKGTANGLEKEDLCIYPLLEPYYEKLDNKTIQRQKKLYFSRIDSLLLKDWLMRYAHEQASKNSGHLWKHDSISFVDILVNNTNELKNAIERGKFPGDKRIGIARNNYKAVFGNDSFDLLNIYYYNYYNAPLIFRDQFEITESNLYQLLPIISLLHDPCAIEILNRNIDVLITSGEMHPRDYALICDWTHEYNKWSDFKLYKIAGDRCSVLYPGINSPVFFNVTIPRLWSPIVQLGYYRNEINSLREKYYIVPIEVDLEKYRVQQTTKMIFYSGFMGTAGPR